jgi:arylsulfatase A-like enzyme
MRRTLDLDWLRTLAGSDQAIARPRASAINARFLEWMGKQKPGHPYFAFINYFDAHNPYIPRHDVFRKIAGYDKKDDLDPLSRYSYVTRKNATPGEIRLARDAHDAAIATQDVDMGNLLDAMEARGMLKNTIVVIVSDHGEELGEHALFYHGHATYATTLHVPLVIFGPGIPKSVRISDPVTLRDLAATIAGLTHMPSGSFPGNSLASFWGDGAPPADPSPIISETIKGIRLPDNYPTARTGGGSIVVDSLHLVEFENGPRHLFNWYQDPREQNDLMKSPAWAASAATLRSKLQEARAAKTADTGRSGTSTGLELAGVAAK